MGSATRVRSAIASDGRAGSPSWPLHTHYLWVRATGPRTRVRVAIVSDGRAYLSARLAPELAVRKSIFFRWERLGCALAFELPSPPMVGPVQARGASAESARQHEKVWCGQFGEPALPRWALEGPGASYISIPSDKRSALSQSGLSCPKLARSFGFAKSYGSARLVFKLAVTPPFLR